MIQRVPTLFEIFTFELVQQMC